jgi:hypothetical protein
MDNYFKTCIEACLRCVEACNHCAASCLKEKNVSHLAKCIQLDIECATLCTAAIQMMSLESEWAGEVCSLCAAVCKSCAGECLKHANEHFRLCYEACSYCAEQCNMMAVA